MELINHLIVNKCSCCFSRHRCLFVVCLFTTVTSGVTSSINEWLTPPVPLATVSNARSIIEQLTTGFRRSCGCWRFCHVTNRPWIFFFPLTFTLLRRSLTVKVINFYHLNVVFKSLISRRFRSNLLLLSIARRWLIELRHRRVGSEWCSVSQISWSSLSKRKLRNIGKVIEPAIKGFTIRGFQAEARPSVLTNLSLHMKIYVGT